MTRIMDQDQVTEYLTQKHGYQMATAVADKIHYTLGIKKEHGGQRFDNFVLVDTLEAIISPQVLREMECHVTTCILPKEHLYYTGVMA